MGATINEIQEASNTDIKMNQELSSALAYHFSALQRGQVGGAQSLSPLKLWCLKPCRTPRKPATAMRGVSGRVRRSMEEMRV